MNSFMEHNLLVSQQFSVFIKLPFEKYGKICYTKTKMKYVLLTTYTCHQHKSNQPNPLLGGQGKIKRILHISLADFFFLLCFSMYKHFTRRHLQADSQINAVLNWHHQHSLFTWMIRDIYKQYQLPFSPISWTIGNMSLKQHTNITIKMLKQINMFGWSFGLLLRLLVPIVLKLGFNNKRIKQFCLGWWIIRCAQDTKISK